MYTNKFNNAGLKIDNPESHPHTGKNWTIFFHSTGKADLTVKPLDESTINDLDFVYLICKDKKFYPKTKDKVGFRFDDWACDGLGALVYKVNVAGNHHFQFKFGKDIAVANNSSQTTYDFTASSSVSRMAYEGKDTASSIPVNVASSSWNVAGSQFSAGMYTNANSSNDAYASTTDNSTSTFKQIVHEFYFQIDEATTTVNRVDYYWEGRATQSYEIANDNDLKMYIYDYANGSWISASTSLDNACNSSDCTLIHSTTSITNSFDRNKGVRFIVQKYEAGSNCSTTPAMNCGKVSTATPPASCVLQSNSEDLWNQCETTDSGGCGTGNCNGTYYTCGVYSDGAQHGNCTAQCQGCKSDGTGCGNINTSPNSGLLGCSGQCYACVSGSCTNVPCENLQCGCNVGYICKSGTCSLPTCTQRCAAIGKTKYQCLNTNPQCTVLGKTVAPGQTTDCTGGIPVCCCN